MKLFTVGPVEMEEEIKEMGSMQLPYFRTTEFSEIMLRIENNLKKIADAPDSAKTVILTASGTGAMEAAVSNLFTDRDRVLVINGGSFGHRFEQLCDCFRIPHDVLTLSFGEELTKEHLDIYSGKNYTGLLVNLHETSTGQLYDIHLLHDFCKKTGALLVVDAISTLLVDPLSMKEDGVDVLICSSQKALSLAPGISFLILDEKAILKIEANNNIHSMYFDLKDYLLNMKRGQTPFTPAVGIILQMDRKLQNIVNFGIQNSIAHHAELAEFFRSECDKYGISYLPFRKSNALTPLYFPEGNAYDTFLKMKEEYGLMLTPNGGALSKTILRVGHLGNLSKQDLSDVIVHLCEVLK